MLLEAACSSFVRSSAKGCISNSADHWIVSNKKLEHAAASLTEHCVCNTRPCQQSEAHQSQLVPFNPHSAYFWEWFSTFASRTQSPLQVQLLTTSTTCP